MYFLIEFLARTVKKNDALLKLTSKEFKLLSILAKNVGCVLTDQYLLKEIWGLGYQNESRYLRVFVGSR